MFVLLPAAGLGLLGWMRVCKGVPVCRELTRFVLGWRFECLRGRSMS